MLVTITAAIHDFAYQLLADVCEELRFLSAPAVLQLSTEVLIASMGRYMIDPGLPHASAACLQMLLVIHE